MARKSSKNTENKSSGIGSGRGNANVNLTADQEKQIVDLKVELKFYQEQLKDVKKKRRKIKNILDNLENIILGDVIIDVLPDENSEEIINSPIISKIDIKQKLSGIDITEIFEEIETTEFVPYTGTFGTGQNVTSTELVGTGVTVSGYDSNDITTATTLLDKIFEQNVAKELISFSSELNNNELYLPVYLQLINDISSQADAKEILRDILSEIENSLL